MASFKWVVFVIVTDVYLGSGLNAPFTKAPSSPVYADPGSNVTLEWDYDSAKLQRIIIYKKAGSYIVLVTKDNSGNVLTNPTEPASITSRVTIKDNATFVIRKVTYSDSTTYMCAFEFLSGAEVREDEVQVIVNRFTENATVEPSVEQAALSTSAMFTCTSDGIPSSNFTWTRLYSANERRETGNRVKITSAGSSSTLTIHRVDYAHHGMYQCEARDPRRPRQNVAYATGILVAPYFRALPAPYLITIPAKIEEKVALACPVFGFPRPAIKWRYPDGNTKEDLLANIQYITMQNADDFGEYSCTAGDKVFTFMVENTAQCSDCSNLITAIIILVVVLMLPLVVIPVLSVKLYKAQPPSSDCTTESVVNRILVVILILALVVIVVLHKARPSFYFIAAIVGIIIPAVMLILAFVALLVLSLKLYKAKKAVTHQELELQQSTAPP